MNRPRPFGVTLLAILAGIAGLVAAYHTFQYLHILPFSLGPVAFYGFDLLGALLWGITTIIYAWVVSMLWTVNPSGWMFVRHHLDREPGPRGDRHPGRLQPAVAVAGADHQRAGADLLPAAEHQARVRRARRGL